MNKKSNKSSSSSSIKLLEYFSKHVIDPIFSFISLASVSQNYSEDIALLYTIYLSLFGLKYTFQMMKNIDMSSSLLIQNNK